MEYIIAMVEKSAVYIPRWRNGSAAPCHTFDRLSVTLSEVEASKGSFSEEFENVKRGEFGETPLGQSRAKSRRWRERCRDYPARE